MRMLMTVLRAAALLALASAIGPAAPAARADAIPLGLGTVAAVAGDLAAGETDTYRLNVIVGRTYVVETFAVERGAGAGTLLSVYDDSGHRLASGSPGAGDADRTLEITAPADGPLELRVSGRDGWAGAYRLRALPTTGDPGAAWDSRGEPDGWCSIAHLLGVGEEASGDIAPANPATISWYPDGDSYAVDLTPGKSYLVEAAGLPADAPAGAVRLTVFEQASEFMLGGAQSGAQGAPAQLIVTPQANARYCVTVSGSDDAPWAGAYRVSAAELGERLFMPTVWR